MQKIGEYIIITDAEYKKLIAPVKKRPAKKKSKPSPFLRDIVVSVLFTVIVFLILVLAKP